jgi:hypothetical protein
MAVYNTVTEAYDNGEGLVETSLIVLKDGSVVTASNRFPVDIANQTVNIDTSTPLDVNIPGDVNVTQGTTPWVVSGNVNATLTGGIGEVSFPTAQIDAFGRLRVSEPFTLFDSSLRYRDDTDKWNHTTSGSASVLFLNNESSVRLSTGGTGEVIRESKRVFKYQSGKSLLVMNTFVMNTPTANVRQRVGYFGAQNGVYFQVDGTTKSFRIRSYVGGSVDDNSDYAEQSNWNTDTLDGSGDANNPSGIELDVTAPQIFFTDIEWLGVGTVRCGFVIDGQFIVCHKFHHANNTNFSGVYMTTATLPIRYEITSTGPSATMKQICSTVMSEGGYANQSQSASASTALSGIGLSQTSFRPLVSIRLKSGYTDAVAIPQNFSVYGLQTVAFNWRLYWDPNVTNGSWTSHSVTDSVEYNVTANNNISSGTVIAEGIIAGGVANGGSVANPSLNTSNFSYQLGRTIAGVSDVFTLACLATTNNDNAVGSMTWEVHT